MTDFCKQRMESVFELLSTACYHQVASYVILNSEQVDAERLLAAQDAHEQSQRNAVQDVNTLNGIAPALCRFC